MIGNEVLRQPLEVSESFIGHLKYLIWTSVKARPVLDS